MKKTPSTKKIKSAPKPATYTISISNLAQLYFSVSIELMNQKLLELNLCAVNRISNEHDKLIPTQFAFLNYYATLNSKNEIKFHKNVVKYINSQLEKDSEFNIERIVFISKVIAYQYNKFLDLSETHIKIYLQETVEHLYSNNKDNEQFILKLFEKFKTLNELDTVKNFNFYNDMQIIANRNNLNSTLNLKSNQSNSVPLNIQSKKI